MERSSFIEKYKHLIPYAFFGVCTTLVNMAVYWVCAHALNMDVMPSTVIAWVLAVLFAYVVNRKWVFYSQVKGALNILKEMAAFFEVRIATGVIDVGCMYFLVELAGLDDVIIKFVANVLVIVLNYVGSRFMVFKKGL